MNEAIGSADEPLTPEAAAALASLLLYTTDAKMAEYRSSNNPRLQVIASIHNELIEVEADGSDTEKLNKCIREMKLEDLITQARLDELIESCRRDFPPLD